MKTITLTSSYDICASHQLYRSDWTKEKSEAVFGHCTRLHGHQYKLEVTLTGPIDADTGMLINGYEVDKIIRGAILDQIDHRHLNNDIAFFKTHQPTAEWIAVWIFGELKGKFPASCAVKNVRLYETPNLYADYSE